jgi:hypothetical protein
MIDTVYLIQAIKKLKEGKKRTWKKENGCECIYYISLWLRNCAKHFVNVPLCMSLYIIFIMTLRDRYYYYPHELRRMNH